MSKKLRKLFAFILAFALVITTFGSDFASAVAYAAEEGENAASSSESIWEDVSDDDPVIIDTQKLDQEDSFEEEQNASNNEESNVTINENSSDNSNTGSGAEATADAASAGDTITNGDETDATESASVENSSEEDAASDASSEDASSEDASALLSSEEVEEVELEFNQSAEFDGMIISLFAKEGVLPADAELRIEKVEDDIEEQIADVIDDVLGSEKDVIKTYSYDINIYSKSEGGFVQPEDGTVKVTFEKIQEAADTDTTLAVYHVEDDLSDVTRVATAYSDATEVSFEAEHFSIYAVTLYEHHFTYSDKVSLKINILDEEDHDILGAATEADLNYWGTYYINVKDLAYQLCDNIDNQRFSLISATCKGKDFTIIKKKYDGRYALYNIEEFVAYVDELGEGDVVLKFAHATEHHLDLGFLDAEEYQFYLDNNAVIKAKVGYNTYKMYASDYDEDIKSYEYRADLNRRVLATEPVTFTITYGNQEFSYTTTVADNVAAARRCYDNHSHRKQKVYGFDYLFSFADDFQLKGDVVYHKNDGTVAQWADTVKWGWKEGNTKTYTVIGIDTIAAKPDAPENFDKNGSKQFLGWKLADGTPVTDNITITKGQQIDLYADWDDGEVYVAVYATDGSGKAVVNPQFKTMLGLKYVQKDSYYPVGVIKLPASFFAGKTSPYIQSEDDLNEVLSAISEIDTSYLIGDGVNNAGNTVAANLKYVQKDVGKESNSKFTALFDWNRFSYSITNPAGGDFKYHLDLRFATNTVTYKGVYFTGETRNETKTLGAGSLYISGTSVTYKDASEYVVPYSNGYKLADIYTDEACTQKFTGFDAISQDTTLYAKFTKSDRESVGFFIIKDSYAGTPNAGPQDSKYYYPENSNVSEWSGTAKNFDLLTPTYTGSNGYVAIYNWTTGIKQSEVEWAYDPGVKEKINSYISSTFGPNFSESDVVWYVYKRQSSTSRHIDGYVAANVTYNANKGGTTADGKIEVADSKVRFGTTVSVLPNMFTTTDSKFIGWNTKADGTGTWYGTTYNNKTIKVNDKIVLYAQWTKEVTFKANFIIQGSDGSFYTDGEPNYFAQKEFKIDLKEGETKEVTSLVYNNSKPAKISSFTPFLVPAVGGVKVMFDRNIVDDYGVTYTVASEEVAGNWSGTVSENGDTVVLNIYYMRDDFSTDIVVTAADEEWFYDGTAHGFDKEIKYTYTSSAPQLTVTDVTFTDTKVTDVSDTAQGNRKITSFKVKNSETNKEYTYIVKDGKAVTDANVPMNVTVVNGTLKIKPRTVTLSSKDLTKKFDFKALTADERVAAGEKDAKDITASAYNAETGEGFVAGEGIDASKTVFTGSRVEVGGAGLMENTFEYTLSNGLFNKTKAENYTITRNCGDLVMTDGSIVIKVRIGADGSGGDTVVPYSGSAQTADLTVHVYVDEVDNSGLDVVFNTIRDLSSALCSLGSFVVYAEEGLPEVDESLGKKVDAEVVEINGVKVTVDNLYVSGGEGTDAGTYPIYLDSSYMTVEAEINGKKVNAKDSVKIEVENDFVTVTEEENSEGVGETEDKKIIGNLIVEKRKVTLTSGSDRREYNGSALTNHTVTVSGEGFANGERGQEGALYNVTGSQLDEGESANTFTYTLYENTNPDNYEITKVEGRLSIYRTGGGTGDEPTGGTVTTFAVAAPPAGTVLGARREEPAPNGQAVLGARRGGTDDPTNNLFRVFTIIVAAGIAVTLIMGGKRRKAEEE